MRTLKTCGMMVGEFVEGSLFPQYLTKPDFMTNDDVPILASIINEIAGLREMSVLVPTDYNDVQIAQKVSTAVEKWSTERKPLFEKVYSLLSIEYNPIENYDRQEETTTHSTGASNSTNTSTSASDSTSNSASTSAGASDSDSTSKIKPIDVVSDDSMVTSGGGDSHTESVNSDTANSSSKSTEAVNSTSESTNAGETTVTSRVHGNIGIVDNTTLLSKTIEFKTAYSSALRYMAETFVADFAIDFYDM